MHVSKVKMIIPAFSVTSQYIIIIAQRLLKLMFNDKSKCNQDHVLEYPQNKDNTKEKIFFGFSLAQNMEKKEQK